MSDHRRAPRRDQGNRKPRRETRRPLAVLASALVFLTILGVASWVAIVAPDGIPVVGSYRSYQAVVPDAGNLQPHNEVRIRGVRVGQVIRVEPDDGKARVELQVGGSTGQIPADSTVAVRGQGLLGARFVEIEPGRSDKPAPSGAVLRGGADALTFGIPETLDTFDTETRGALGNMLDGFGQGLLGNGDDLNRALAVAPGANDDFQGFIAAVLARGDAARVLAPSLNSTFAALDSAGEDVPRGIGPAAQTFEAFADRRESLKATLDEAPSTLQTADRGLQQGRRLLGSVRSLSVAASGTLPAAPGALRATTQLLRDSQPDLVRANGLLRAVRPAVPATLRITGAVRPILRPLDRLFNDARPPVVALGERSCDIVNFAQNWRSVLGHGVPDSSAYNGTLNNFHTVAKVGPEAVNGLTPVTDLTQAAGFSNLEPYGGPPCKYSPPGGQDFPLGNPLGVIGK